MERVQILACGGIDLSVLKPIQYSAFEIRQATALVEGQKGATCGNGHDRYPGHALDHSRIDNDQRVVVSR